MVIAAGQLHSTKAELRFCAGSNPARGVSQIRDGEDLCQYSRLEIKLHTFRRSTILQKQFAITHKTIDHHQLVKTVIQHFKPFKDLLLGEKQKKPVMQRFSAV